MPFTWGDSVRIKDDAPTNLRPGERASIVGLPTKSNRLYVVEFPDGSDAQIPEQFLVAESP
jgi:hypothetical protein